MRRLTKLEARIKRQCTRVIGRAKYCRAEMCLGCQGFIVMRYDGTRRDAEWYRRQVAIALAGFYETERENERELRRQRAIRTRRGAAS